MENGDNARGRGADASVAATVPWDTLCEGILAAYKTKEDIVVLQRFEELQVMPELDVLVSAQRPDIVKQTLTMTSGDAKGDSSALSEASAISDALEKVEFCWGRAVLSAKRIAGDDDEHINLIVESFEQRFERPSEYLRVLAITADSALEVLRIHQLMEAHVSVRAVTAALHMFPSLSANETSELLKFLRANEISLTKEVTELLEKHFVLRMKTEDAEEVFHEMCAAGVNPVSTRPYNFVFMKTTPFKYMSLIEYYEDMLDRGITPENSTFRILSKQTQYEGFANQHFSTLAWGNSTANRHRDDGERGGTQVFFASRLTELARTKPEATLDEALRVFSRMDVEGTRLTNGSLVISALLIHCCHQENLEDAERVLNILKARGCHPTTATVQRVLKGNNPHRFHHAEMLIQRVVETGEVLQLVGLELLRYFVINNVRGKAVRTFRAYVVQSYRHPKEPIPFAVASMAIKLGPLEWALGVLAILLVSADKPFGRGIQTRMRHIAHDSRSRDVLAVLERCDWRRERLLTAPEFQEPASTNSNGGADATNAAWADPKGHPKPDRGVTWMGALHIALTEANVEPEVMEAYKTALLEAIETARKHRGSLG